MDLTTIATALTEFLSFSAVHPIVAALFAVLGTVLALAYFYKKFVGDNADSHENIISRLDAHEKFDVAVAHRLSSVETKLSEVETNVAKIDGKLDTLIEFVKSK